MDFIDFPTENPIKCYFAAVVIWCMFIFPATKYTSTHHNSFKEAFFFSVLTGIKMYPTTAVDDNERLRHLMFMSVKRKQVVSFDLEVRRWREVHC